MPTDFDFNGVYASDYGVHVLDVKEEHWTSRDGEGIPVPGRTGELYRDNGRYENVNVIYQCAIVEDSYEQLRAFNAKLLSMTGIHRLRDSFDPTVAYMLGRYNGAIEPRIARSGDKVRVDFTFNCGPQKYLRSGDTPVSFTPTPKTLPTTYSFSDFSSAAQYRINMYLTGAGYSSAEVQAMDYLLCNQTLSEDVTVSIEAESNQPFFALVVNRDPQTLPAWDPSMYMGISHIKKFKTNRAVWGDDIYVIIARVPEAKIYFGDTLVLDYDYFDEQSLTNSTNFEALPIIRAEVSSTFDDYLFGVNDCSLKYNSGADDMTALISAITLNCETMNCYSLPEDNQLGTQINCNKYIELSNYSMRLTPGENDILIGNYCDKLEITPRWWTL